MRFRRIETIEAEQWFPGSRIEGVRGSDCSCGCQGPHVHPSHLDTITVDPGDWIVKIRDDYTCISDERMRKDYEPVVDWCGELMRVVALLDRTIGFHLWESPGKEDVIREYLTWKRTS